MNVKVVFVYIDTIDHGTGYYLSNWDLVVSRAVFQVRESPNIAAYEIAWVHAPHMRGFNELFYDLPRELQLQLDQDTLRVIVGGVCNAQGLYTYGVFHV